MDADSVNPQLTKNKSKIFYLKAYIGSVFVFKQTRVQNTMLEIHWSILIITNVET